MNHELFLADIHELDPVQELMNSWERKFYRSMLEHLAAEGYLFSGQQVATVRKLREKYDLDIRHREVSQ